jgi:hypothetical protein
MCHNVPVYVVSPPLAPFLAFVELIHIHDSLATRAFGQHTKTSFHMFSSAHRWRGFEQSEQHTQTIPVHIPCPNDAIDCARHFGGRLSRFPPTFCQNRGVWFWIDGHGCGIIHCFARYRVPCGTAWYDVHTHPAQKEHTQLYVQDRDLINNYFAMAEFAQVTSHLSLQNQRSSFSSKY